MKETIVAVKERLKIYNTLRVKEIAKPIKSANLFGASSHISGFKSSNLIMSLAKKKNGLNSGFLRALAEKSNNRISAKTGNLVNINSIAKRET